MNRKTRGALQRGIGMKVGKASAYGLRVLMYMVRHVTQLPAGAEAIGKTEGIPARHLGKVLVWLADAGFIRLAQGRESGYVFARPPQEIAPKELLEALEGQPLFDFDPGQPGGLSETPEEGRAPARWVRETRQVGALFEEASVVAAAWRDLEERFGTPPRTRASGRLPIRSVAPRKRPASEESSPRDV
jgi:Rrf2 family protein